MVQPLDYETPPTAPAPSRSYKHWIAFVVAYFPGLMVLQGVDDFIVWRWTGHYGDGTVLILAAFAFPVFLILFGIWQEVRRPTVWGAIAYAILGPIIAYLVWVGVSVF